MAKVLIERNDGGLSIMSLIEGGDPATEVVKWAVASGWTAQSWSLVADNFPLPADRTFRGAWRRNGGGNVVVHMATARQLQRQRIRDRRREIFPELDRLQATALSAGTCTVDAALAAVVGLAAGSYNAAAIEARKQVLRDAPQHPDIDNAANAAALALAWGVV